MMLLWKAVLESRARFLFGAIATEAACVYAWYGSGFAKQGVPRTTFIVFCFLFGMGGLLREHAVGTASFTLALPVGRLHLVAARAIVGWLELSLLALVPTLFMTSPFASYTLWVAGGSTMFAVSFLASCVFAGEYTAFVVAWTVFFGHTVTTQVARLLRPALWPYLFTVQEIMSRLRPFPSAVAVTACAAITCSLIATAALITTRTDF